MTETKKREDIVKMISCKIAICENGHETNHRGKSKKGTQDAEGWKIEVPKDCLKCQGKIVKIKNYL